MRQSDYRNEEMKLAAREFKSICLLSRRVTALGALAVMAVAICANSAASQTRSLGIDISAWQGNLSQSTWNSFAGAGNRDFVFIRASRGGTTGYYNQSNADNDPVTNYLSQRYDDPYFVQNITRATQAGMFAGPYHFGRMDIIESTLESGGIANNGTDEADHFIQMAGAWMRPGYLLPIFDHEAGISQRTPNQLAQFAIDFSNRIYEVMGIRPGIYIGGNYASNLESASQSRQDQITDQYTTTWHARWPNQNNPDAIPVQTGHPKDSLSYIYGPWDNHGTTHPWSFWQYASTGRVPGYGGNLDLNVAQGGIEFLKDKLVPAVWMNDSDGDWNSLANWNSGQPPIEPVQGPGQVPRVGPLTLPTPRLPGVDDALRNVDGQNDTVVLDRPHADITVTLSSGTHNIRKLYVREALDITGGSLTINYTPSADSTPHSAQFSAPVSLSGNASFTVHTLDVDAAATFTLSGGTLSASRIYLAPHPSTPAKLLVDGDVVFDPWGDSSSVIGAGSGSGASGMVDLGGGLRSLTVGDVPSATDLTITVPVTNGGLRKLGPGTLRLTGENSYSLDTVVEEGTLRLYSPFLSDTADVYLTSGGVLDLSTGTSTDVIGALFIDGAMQPAGTWGAMGSLAEFTTPLITGSGILHVTAAPPSLPGDFNGDGHVDGRDFLAWQRGESPEHGSDADLATWQTHYGAEAAMSASVVVPEPVSMALAVVGLAAIITHRRR